MKWVRTVYMDFTVHSAETHVRIHWDLVRTCQITARNIQCDFIGGALGVSPDLPNTFASNMIFYQLEKSWRNTLISNSKLHTQLWRHLCFHRHGGVKTPPRNALLRHVATFFNFERTKRFSKSSTLNTSRVMPGMAFCHVTLANNTVLPSEDGIRSIKLTLSLFSASQGAEARMVQ